MRITDYFRLSWRYLRTHLDRFIITLVTLVLLITILMVFTSAYSSGATAFEKGIADNYKTHGVMYTTISDINQKQYNELNEFLETNFHECYSLEQAIRLPINETYFDNYAFPYALQYHAASSIDSALVVEGEAFDINVHDNKIWIPSINEFFGVPLKVGDSINIRIKVKDSYMDISPTIAGFLGNNSRDVFIGINYAFALNLPVNTPKITLMPQDLSYKQIMSTKQHLERGIGNIFSASNINANYFSDSRYYEEYQDIVNKNTIMLVLVIAVIGVLSILSLSNSLMLSVMDNSHSVVLLKSLGLKNRSLFAILCLEGIYLIILSGVLAIALTYAFYPIIVSISSWLWGSTLMMFGTYSITAVVPISLILIIMLLFSVLMLITVYLGFLRSSKKYTQHNMAVNNI